MVLRKPKERWREDDNSELGFLGFFTWSTFFVLSVFSLNIVFIAVWLGFFLFVAAAARWVALLLTECHVSYKSALHAVSRGFIFLSISALLIIDGAGKYNSFSFYRSVIFWGSLFVAVFFFVREFYQTMGFNIIGAIVIAGTVVLATHLYIRMIIKWL